MTHSELVSSPSPNIWRSKLNKVQPRTHVGPQVNLHGRLGPLYRVLAQERYEADTCFVLDLFYLSTQGARKVSGVESRGGRRKCRTRCFPVMAVDIVQGRIGQKKRP
ncbi:hypothetical protein KM043_004493 [Ampulex compressa]|nr:hypothetical protein KM043_004493 [Ampulex compressa]